MKEAKNIKWKKRNRHRYILMINIKSVRFNMELCVPTGISHMKSGCDIKFYDTAIQRHTHFIHKFYIYTYVIIIYMKMFVMPSTEWSNDDTQLSKYHLKWAKKLREKKITQNSSNHLLHGSIHFIWHVFFSYMNSESHQFHSLLNFFYFSFFLFLVHVVTFFHHFSMKCSATLFKFAIVVPNIFKWL